MYLSPNGFFMKLFFTLTLIGSAVIGHSQKVGIGITNPQEKLHVDSNIRIGIGAWASPTHNRYFKIGDGNYVTIGEVGLDDRLEFSAREFIFRNSGAYGVNNGKVGINTTGSPTAFLEVNGNVKITDGTQSDGRVLTSAGDGTASWQNIPLSNSGFHATLQSANQVVVNATDAVVIFENEQFDDGLGYNASNGFFTVPANGVYQFNVKIQWTLAASTQPLLFVFLDVNGSKAEEAKDVISTGAGTSFKTISFSTVLKVNAGDVLKVNVRQESSANQEVATVNSSFSGHRLY